MRARCIIFGSKWQKQQSLTVIIVKHLNSLTEEGQFQLGSGVMKKNYFLTCSFSIFFIFFYLPNSFFVHNFLLFRTAANSRSNVFLCFSNIFMVFQKNGKQGAKNDSFLF